MGLGKITPAEFEPTTSSLLAVFPLTAPAHQGRRLRTLELHKEREKNKNKKNEKKCRKEANTPEIFLVVLQNKEEVNFQETFICIL